MKRRQLAMIATILLTAALTGQAAAQIIYTPVNVSIPAGGAYNIDLNGDGVTDFTLRSILLQDYCQFGDGYMWSLMIVPASRNAVATAGSRFGSSSASALQYGMPVSASRSFLNAPANMAELSWGLCGTGTSGEWLNQPARYLGLQFRGAANDVHYAWAKVSTVAYVDQAGVLHASTFLSGVAYESGTGQQIAAGQTSDTQSSMF